MIRFEYDNIDSESVILEFKCCYCKHNIITKILQVPEMNLNDMESSNMLSHNIVCKCGKKYTIQIYNGVYGYGIVEELEYDQDSVLVHEITGYPLGKNTIFIDIIHSISTMKSIVNEIEEKEITERTYLYNLILINLTSLIDSYLKIRIEPIILSEESLISRFIHVFKNRKKNESERDYIKRYFESHSFQSLLNQQKLLFGVLQIRTKYEFPRELNSLIIIRNLLVHRNGIHTDGYVYKVTKNQLLNYIQIVKQYIVELNRLVMNYETEIAVRRYLNNYSK